MSVYRPYKQTERRVARVLGGRRTGHTGKADVTAGWLVAECKHRKKLPAWLKDAIAQAKRNAGVSQLGVVVLHEHGQRGDRDIVCLSLADWLEWFGTNVA